MCSAKRFCHNGSGQPLNGDLSPPYLKLSIVENSRKGGLHMSAYEILTLIFGVIDTLLVLTVIFLTHKMRPHPSQE